ncbi:G-protein coupled receptor 98 [Collichthys lucidus]|uniref:G-protein coupled receptor 98 n=1 Tax=Collichthys lucidus TaxID=240159 RepID=A0A4U5UW55_COLLU|nr:G-protein coupled receptor 98 [Collichthys lucidus]
MILMCQPCDEQGVHGPADKDQIQRLGRNKKSTTQEPEFVQNRRTDGQTQNVTKMMLQSGWTGLNVSDNESIPGSHDGGSVANSQIVELRRIPIADTHL